MNIFFRKCFLILLFLIFSNISAQTMKHRGVTRVTFSPDGKILASCGEDWKIRLWEVSTRKLISEFEHDNYTYSIVFSPDGKKIAYGTFENEVYIREVSTGKIVTSFPATSDALCFSPDGKKIAIGGINGSVGFYDIKGKRALTKCTVGEIVSFVEFSADGKMLLVSSYQSDTGSGSVSLWEVQLGKMLWKSKEHYISLGEVSFDPKGNIAVFGHEKLMVLDTKERKMIHKLEMKDCNCVAFSPDEKVIMGGDFVGNIWFWEVKSGQLIGSLKQFGDSSIRSLDCSSNSGYIAMCSYSENAIILEKFDKVIEQAKVLENLKLQCKELYFCTKEGERKEDFTPGEAVYLFVAWKMDEVPNDFQLNLIIGDEDNEEKRVEKSYPALAGETQKIIKLDFVDIHRVQNTGIDIWVKVKSKSIYNSLYLSISKN